MGKRVLIYLLIGVALWAAGVLFLQRRVLFPYASILTGVQEAPMKSVDLWRLDTPEGPVEAWLLPGDGVSADHPGPAVIYAHGNGEIIDPRQHEMGGYTRRGVSVLLIEYRGYGRSAGTPSQKKITADAVRFYDRLAARPDVDPDRIVFHGRSLGGGVVASLARHRRPAAMILQSTFTSVTALAWRFGVPPFMVRDPFRVKSVLKKYTGPVLILHGTHDHLIPPPQARGLHAAARDSRLIFYDMGHNTPPPPQQYWKDISTFLHHAGILGRGDVAAEVSFTKPRPAVNEPRTK